MSESCCNVDHRPSASNSHDDHDHHDAGDANRYSRVRIAFFVGLAVILLQGLGTYLSGSLALFADTIHVVSDIASLGLSWLAGMMAMRPHSHRRSYGYYRMEVLAALANAVVLIVIAGFIAFEAHQRWTQPHEIHTYTMLIFASLGFVANLIMLAILHSSRSSNLNIRGAYLHLLGDTVSSLIVILSAVLMGFGGAIWLDALASLFVSAMIAVLAFRLLRQSVHVLLEGTPNHLDPEQIKIDLQRAFPEISNFHDFHIWEITAQLFSMSAHIEARVKNLEDSQKLLNAINALVRERYQIGHATFQIEVATPSSEPKP